MDPDHNEPNLFEISLRFFGNEIIGVRINSRSRIRAWHVWGFVFFLLASALAVELGPEIVEIARQARDL